MHATYNITDDKIKFWPDGRLTDEQHKQARQWNFAWWPGRKCFAAKWSCGAVDFLAALGLSEIEADDTPDDVESRLDRFSQYAASAAQQAASATERAENATTARRERLSAGVAERESERAQYWQERIAGAVRHAEMKMNPHVIARRIKELEADRRRWAKDTDIKTARYVNPLDYLVLGEDGKRHIDRPRWETAFEPYHRLALRWLAHIDMRLQFERALLEALGGLPADKPGLEVGGAIETSYGWREVLKINNVTVEIDCGPWPWLHKMPKTDIRATMTAADFAAYRAVRVLA